MKYTTLRSCRKHAYTTKAEMLSALDMIIWESSKIRVNTTSLNKVEFESLNAVIVEATDYKKIVEMMSAREYIKNNSDIKQKVQSLLRSISSYFYADISLTKSGGLKVKSG
jgi:hypothetical protein